MISLEDGEKLLRLARNCVKAVIEGKDVTIDPLYEKNYSEKMGCFVTLHKNKELRGCIGFPEPVMPLFKAIMQASQAAAFEDPRFPPLERSELKDVHFEVSVLTQPQLIEVEKPERYVEKVRVGRDGLIVRGTYGSGLLLPQVATEWNWSAQEFLEHTCQKAGLEANAWKDLNNKIFAFQAQVFCEENGNVVEKKLGPES